ncbi:sensor histidine kinase [Dyella choica]|nr:triple tyrosine motif-containing protein [Dyella choica]
MDTTAVFVSRMLRYISPARLVFAFAAFAVWMHPSSASAQTLGSFQHAVYLKQDGWPGNGDMTQTADGFLWISGNKGLTRFDGSRFRTFVPLPGERFLEARLGALHPAQGGGLWIATSDSATLLKDGHLRHYGAQQGYLGNNATFMTDPAGVVWVSTSAGLLRFENDAWHAIYRNRAGHSLKYASFDEAGNLWASIDHQLFVLPKGQSDFQPVPHGPSNAQRVHAGASGHLYVTTNDGIHFYRRNGLELAELAQPLETRIYAVLEGKDHAVWMGSPHDGMYFVSASDLESAEATHVVPRTQPMTREDGLTGNFAAYLIKDDEGDIWVNTPGGLNRFRPAAFTRVKLPLDIHTTSAAPDGAGNLWVGSENNPVLQVLPSGELHTTAVPPLTLALYVAPNGRDVWAANPKGIWRLSPGEPRIEKAIGAVAGPVGALPCMLRDGQGKFYVCVPYSGNGNGLLVSDGEGWKEVFNHPVFPTTLALAPNGDIWTGSRDRNHLYRLAKGVESKFDERQGVAAGVVKIILADEDGLWIGGDNGIQYFDGQRFHTLVTDVPDIAMPVAGLVVDRHGDLWVQTLDGILRIRAADLARFRSGALKRVHADLFDDQDNVSGIPLFSWTSPNLKLGSDGRIWTQTSTAVAWADPDHMQVTGQQPAVYVDYLETSSHAYASARDTLTLSPNEKAVRIGFTSPTLGRPDKLKFRYRLVGMSDAWMDAGDRREAAYTNLAPGSYRFEVMVTNESGLSGKQLGTIRFVRLPAYYETWWFRALWALPVALLLWLAHNARSRALTRRLKIRSDEREAVARDIHDTLLQRLHAVLLSLQRLSQDESIPVAARASLARIRDDTRETISEGREQISMLRRAQDSGLMLYDELMAEGRRLQQQQDIRFAVEVHGEPRPLKSEAAAELRDAALEGMRNAFKHSGGAEVQVTLNYEESAFWVVVSDNGHGFDPQAQSSARHNGHFGLLGMRERVSRLKGAIHIESNADEGTEIHLQVPSRTIYKL